MATVVTIAVPTNTPTAHRHRGEGNRLSGKNTATIGTLK